MFDHALESLEALKESRRQLSTLLSNLPGMAYRTFLDPRWPLEFVSGGCLSLTGHRPEDVISGNPHWSSIIAPEDRDAVWSCVETSVESRQPFTLTYRITTASGHRRWVWEQGRGVYDEEGGLLAIEGFITDITERRSVEERLRRANRLYAVLTRINEAIVRIRHPASLLDEACRIAVEEGRFRAAWIALQDPTEPELLRVAASCGDADGLLSTLLGDQTVLRLQEGHVARANATGQPQIIGRLELEAHFEPWKETLLAHGMQSAAAFPLFVSDRVVGSLNLYSDQSPLFDDDELRLLESLTADLSFALERAEEESCRRSLQLDLARARSIETIGRVAGSLAHDFNNILMIIGACTETLERTLDGSGVGTREIEQIRKASERGSELTRRLLAFGRKNVSRTKRLDAGALVRDMNPLLARLLGESVALEILLAEGEHPVISEPDQLEQVLLNLVLNAKDAMPEGGTVKVRVDQITARHPMGLHGSIRGPYVRISIEDTGHGFSAEARERMFEPFFTTKPSETGSGLGLSIAFDLARKSGGWINAKDAIAGSGALFELHLPRADV